jgi:hypothetical protein
MQIILETGSLRLAHEFLDKLGGGSIVGYDGCPVAACGEYEMTNFSSVTVDVSVPEEVAEDENPDPWGHPTHDRDDEFWDEYAWFE